VERADSTTAAKQKNLAERLGNLAKKTRQLRKSEERSGKEKGSPKKAEKSWSPRRAEKKGKQGGPDLTGTSLGMRERRERQEGQCGSLYLPE